MASTSTSRLEARISPEIHSLLKHAADLQGRTLTDFVVTAAQEAARKVVEDAQVIRLVGEDQRSFVASLINPPAPSDALRRARDRHRRLVEDV